MRAHRFAALVVALALALAAGAAPTAAVAHPPAGRGPQLLPPALTFDGLDGGEAMAQAWARFYVHADNRCLRLGRHGGSWWPSASRTSRARSTAGRRS